MAASVAEVGVARFVIRVLETSTTPLPVGVSTILVSLPPAFITNPEPVLAPPVILSTVIPPVTVSPLSDTTTTFAVPLELIVTSPLEVGILTLLVPFSIAVEDGKLDHAKVPSVLAVNT